MEARIRQQINTEVRASNVATNSDPRISLLKQLSELDPMTMGEIFAVNAQYGEFIQSLNVCEERLDVVINALQNMIADQNQAQSEIMLEYQADPETIINGDLRQQMQEISSTESQLEALACDLSESELDAFTEVQEQRQSNFSPFSIVGGTVDSFVDGPIFLGGDVIQSGSGQYRAIQILPIDPNYQTLSPAGCYGKNSLLNY